MRGAFKENEKLIQRDICTPTFNAALFSISQDMEAS